MSRKCDEQTENAINNRLMQSHTRLMPFIERKRQNEKQFGVCLPPHLRYLDLFAIPAYPNLLIAFGDVLENL